MVRTEREEQHAKKGTLKRSSERQGKRGALSWKPQEGNFEDRSDQCIRFCRKGHNGRRTELPALAFQKARNPIQSSRSKVPRQELECTGISGGCEGGGRASVDSLLKGKEKLGWGLVLIF